MDYSHLTKKEIIEKIKRNKMRISELPKDLKDNKEIILEMMKQKESLYFASERLKDDKDVVLMAIKNNVLELGSASERLQNDKELLEILEKENTSHWNLDYKKWYEDRMNFLNNLRNKEEKEIIEATINNSNIKAKKMKF